MDRFIKKNMFLVGFLGLAAVGVLVLLVFSVFRHAEMRKYIRKTAEMRDTVNSLVRQKPPAVLENITLIQKDIDGYVVKTDELRQYLGQPFRPALDAFSEKLNVPVLQLFQLFRDFWEQEKQMQGPREQTYRRFRASGGRGHDESGKVLWNPEGWDEAMDVFIEKAQGATLEKIDEQNQEEIFLSALGLPRNLGNSPQRLTVFMRTLQGQIVDLLNEKKVKMLGVYFNSVGISPLKTDANFDDQGRRDGEGKARATISNERMTGSDGNSTAAGVATPAAVIRNWEIMSDLAKRIADSGVESLERLAYASMDGRQEGECTYYRYEFVVRGTPRTIRKLLNGLSEAFADNRVYVVRNLAMHKVEDQVQDIIDMAQGVLMAPKSESEGSLELGGDALGMGGSGRLPGGRSGGVKSALTANYFKEQNVYGEVVAGRSELSEAKIVVDYVIYSANELK